MGARIEKEKKDSDPWEHKKKFIGLLENAKAGVLADSFKDVATAAQDVKEKMGNERGLQNWAHTYPQDKLENVLTLMIDQAAGKGVSEEEVQKTINDAWDKVGLEPEGPDETQG